MGSRILVVDDDPSVRRMLARTLAADGHEVEAVADGGQALAAVERCAPEAVVLDVAMPGLDGLAVCRRLRARGVVAPILLLTARDEIADRVAGLDAGADDYLVKPFAVDELRARLRAIGRRGRPRPADAATVLTVGRLVLDVAARQVVFAGRPVALTERECDLLELLLRNAGQVVTREVALERIWGAAVENVVDRYVAQLRRKLADPAVIRTVRGVGFVLDAG
ncbi:response regulator transcription factor [Paraconexibacter antarcticus]|uniref:Response regulator transcription factor n=1 Tax=Paraconexibacter antarcticus TaxID=2949664 RepID=A0ABY5DXJ1_9ACTN|nr:response regulator transcription factor [Paraconexibacter antarcticus]UTI66274.1 response regulator transcription factor [Paraconexibacter antarcticus]